MDPCLLFTAPNDTIILFHILKDTEDEIREQAWLHNLDNSSIGYFTVLMEGSELMKTFQAVFPSFLGGTPRDCEDYLTWVENAGNVWVDKAQDAVSHVKNDIYSIHGLE